jgi:signal transduction histidine kinase
MRRPFLIGKILRSPRKLQAVFFILTLLPAVTLFWLGWRWIELEREKNGQRLEQERRRVADLIGTSLRQALLTDAQRLSDPSVWRDLDVEGARFITFPSSAPEGFEIQPNASIAYYPYRDSLAEAPESVFRPAEEDEYGRRDYPRAIEKYRELARSADAAVRAGAMIRWARALRSAGRLTEALDVYSQLSRERAGSGIPGVPAELEALRLRCSVLEQLNQTANLHREAEALWGDLRGAHWRLDWVNYGLYVNQVRAWLPPDRAIDFAPAESEVLAEAVTQVARKWQAMRENVASLTLEAGPDFAPVGAEFLAESRRALIWNRTGGRLVALATGPRYLESKWAAAVTPLVESQRVRVALEGDDGRPFLGEPFASGVQVTRQSAADTRLPGTLAIGSADPRGDDSEYGYRDRLLLGSLALALIAVVAGSYFVSRAVQRELALARLQSDFVAAVSHEFRTPLTSLSQATELLADGRVSDPERLPAYYKAQARATSRLWRLVESLLDFSRMEADAKPYHMREIDIAALTRSVVEQFRDHAPAGYPIELEMSSGACTIHADAEAISTALRNLLDNAVKYSPVGATVRTELAPVGRRIAIAVRDEGVGVPLSEQRRIFRKFVRGAAAIREGIKGTGVG